MKFKYCPQKYVITFWDKVMFGNTLIWRIFSRIYTVEKMKQTETNYSLTKKNIFEIDFSLAN